MAQAQTDLPELGRTTLRPGQRVSVVIPTAERPVELDRCLHALALQVDPPLEIIVVDNTPGTAVTAAIAQKHGAKLVVEPRPGLSRARNTGARRATGAVVAYLDDDSVPAAEWCGGIAAAFDDTLVMAAAGRTLPLRLETEAERAFAAMRGPAYDRKESFVVSRDQSDWFERSAFGGIGAGCNMAVRRSAFDRWPGFNERTGRGTPLVGGDEHHAFFSLVEQGHRVAYSAAAVVLHPYPSSLDELKRNLARDLTASTAFFTLLLVEHPSCRGATLRYLADSVLGRRRGWRPTGVIEPPPPMLSRWRRMSALGLGPFRYLRSRLV